MALARIPRIRIPRGWSIWLSIMISFHLWIRMAGLVT